MDIVIVFLMSLTIYKSESASHFPPDFKFGVASSAYQVEGGWNENGKSDSIWDHFIHTNSNIIEDHSSGDISCDSYHLWNNDVQLVEDLGVDFYRFSISWTRILPDGIPTKINEDGVNYYGNIIDALLKKNIEPMVTIYHFDLPQRLQELGGWANPLTADWFADYANILFTLYADRVKTWITINEPQIICDLGYGNGAIPPRVFDPQLAMHLCTKHILLAHAKAYRIYDQNYRAKYKGQVALSNHIYWFEPATAEDEELTELMREYAFDRFCHPVYSEEGGWPPNLENFLALQGEKENQPGLPNFTSEEKDLIKGTYDFFSLNHYSSRVVRKPKVGESIGAWPLFGAPELGAIFEGGSGWETSSCDWLLIYPEGLRNSLTWVKKQYGDVNILITENGFPSTDDKLADLDRIQYFKRYLEQVVLAMEEDGVNVTAYTAWSLMDSFEWAAGYTIKFGLHKVDFTDPGRKRTPRMSAEYYRNVIKERSLAVDVETIKEEL